jgi:23S rRNA maturation mini-RNase III
MADKVDAVLEKMTDELQYYLREGLFSKKEVKKIVKERRNAEYKLHRKDANVMFFIESIKFER